MSEINPYAPPQVEVIVPAVTPEVLRLPSRWIRLAGAAIDGVIVGVAVLAIRFAMGAYSTWQSTGDSFGGGISFPSTFGWSLAVIPVWIVLNWVLLQKGQTIGKRILGMQIRRRDGSPATAGRIVALRFAPVHILGAIPYLGFFVWLLDVVMIFRENRNTLHDDMAETMVVQL